ncbi:MAG: hypothetical protein Q8O99_02395 [bacterium]|nr:hypothetical protein [bacterium]
MIRIIMANYLIASIILAFSNFIDLISSSLLVGNVVRRVDGLQHRFGKLLIAGKPTLLLSIYFVLLIFLVTKSRIGIGKIRNEAMRRLLTLIFLPCTIISIMLSISMAIFGNQLVSLEGLKTLAQNFSAIPTVYNLIMLTPLRIILPGVITILVAILILRGKEPEITQEHKDQNIVIELENDKK